jgi:cardiolipin synthase A/B
MSSSETKHDEAVAARLAATPIPVAGHELTLFVESAPMIHDMAADIQKAGTRVWLESYIFAGDAAGRRIAAALADRARAGADVRLLYDAIGSQATPPALFAELVAAGVQVHAFHSFLYALRNLSFFEILNRRDHRKLLVIDERTAYFGGMNIVETSRRSRDRSATYQHPAPRDGAAASGRPIDHDLGESGGWRDVHVRVVGPQVAEVAESFDRSWRRAHHEPIDRRPRSYRRVRLPRGSGEFIRFSDSGPGLQFSRAERVFTRMIGLARRRVVMSMAYFLPTRRVLRTILRVARRGCRVTVIVPGASDVPLVQRATRFLYARLLKRGIEIFERQRSMLHSKVTVIDDMWTVVGSCNLDPRSLEINLEFLAVIRSPALAQAVTAICDQELAASHPVTAAQVQRHSFWQRLLDRVAYLLRWLL